MLLSDEDRRIYSVGISTGGIAEMRMAASNAKRHIIATTIDPDGALFAEQQIEHAGLVSQIEIRMEDVAKPLSYADGYFDFIYARLVLHYLPKDALLGALNELFRILRPGGRIFVVVRSEECPEARGQNAILDVNTGMTTYISHGHSFSRYFHTEESIQQHLKAAGFQIKQVKSYKEQLCVDFQRLQLAAQVDVLIEVLAAKSSDKRV